MVAKHPQLAAQRGLIFAQALLRFFGVIQHGVCIRQETLSGLRQTHPHGYRVAIAADPHCSSSTRR